MGRRVENLVTAGTCMRWWDMTPRYYFLFPCITGLGAGGWTSSQRVQTHLGETYIIDVFRPEAFREGRRRESRFLHVYSLFNQVGGGHLGR